MPGQQVASLRINASSEVEGANHGLFQFPFPRDRPESGYDEGGIATAEETPSMTAVGGRMPKRRPQLPTSDEEFSACIDETQSENHRAEHATGDARRLQPDPLLASRRQFRRRRFIASAGPIIVARQVIS
jgi:hypothetical protein